MASLVWILGTSWSPNGDRLAIGACENGYHVCGIHVVDVADGELTGVARRVVSKDYDHGEIADLPSWSPDGRFLAYRVRDTKGVETVERVAVDAAGAPQATPVTLTDRRVELPVQWARDSRSIAFASSTHLLTDQYRAGFVLDLDAAGRPDGAPRLVTPLSLVPNALIWGPPVLDTTAPTASATLDKPANGAGWHREAVVARLRAQDDAGGDGVASITYTVDGKKTTATRSGAGRPARRRRRPHGLLLRDRPGGERECGEVARRARGPHAAGGRDRLTRGGRGSRRRDQRHCGLQLLRQRLRRRRL